jgi:hypothetical protein
MRPELRLVRALDYCTRMADFGVDPLWCLERAVRDEKVDELLLAKVHNSSAATRTPGRGQFGGRRRCIAPTPFLEQTSGTAGSARRDRRRVIAAAASLMPRIAAALLAVNNAPNFATQVHQLMREGKFEEAIEYTRK